MMYLFIFFSLVLQFEITPLNYSVQYKPTLIFTKSLSEDCAVFEVFDYGDGQKYYYEATSKRDDAAFYYTDEDKKEVIIQKKIGDDQYHLRYVFVFNKKTYEIVLKSCSSKLSANKKELNLIHYKIIHHEL